MIRCGGHSNGGVMEPKVLKTKTNGRYCIIPNCAEVISLFALAFPAKFAGLVKKADAKREMTSSSYNY
jgi:hypothetical protein